MTGMCLLLFSKITPIAKLLASEKMTVLGKSLALSGFLLKKFILFFQNINSLIAFS